MINCLTALSTGSECLICFAISGDNGSFLPWTFCPFDNTKTFKARWKQRVFYCRARQVRSDFTEHPFANAEKIKQSNVQQDGAPCRMQGDNAVMGGLFGCSDGRGKSISVLRSIKRVTILLLIKANESLFDNSDSARI